MVCVEWSVLKGVLLLLSPPVTVSIKKKKIPMISCFNLLHFPSYHFLGYRDVLVYIELWFSFSLFLFLNLVLFDFEKSVCFFNALGICFKYSDTEDFVGMSVMHLQPSLSPPEQILPHTDVPVLLHNNIHATFQNVFRVFCWDYGSCVLHVGSILQGRNAWLGMSALS